MLIRPAYVLISPARNEANFIELTIKSVVAQTVRPLKWIIVSDGSTDGTDEIVRQYANEHSWIELVRMPERRERHFAGKVHAFNAGYTRVKDLAFEVIGNLDADVSFDDKDYFLFLMNKFAEDPRLGVGGTPYQQENSTYDYRFVNIEDVSGACQLFRRECFEEIGGYLPLKGGGVDHVAFLTARMKGWQTRTFIDKVSNEQETFSDWGADAGLRLSVGTSPARRKTNVPGIDRLSQTRADAAIDETSYRQPDLFSFAHCNVLLKVGIGGTPPLLFRC